MAVYTTKPATVGTTANPDSSGNLIGTHSSALFRIHVWAIDHEYYSPTAEVTGDGHADPVFINNGMAYGRIILTGAMIDDSSGTPWEIGISKLFADNGGPTFNKPALLNVILRFSSAQEITVTLLVERIRLQWRKTGVYVPMSMICRVTNTDMDAAALES